MVRTHEGRLAGGRRWLCGLALLFAGALSACDPNATGLCDDIQRAKAAIDQRLVDATKAGLAEARRREIPDLPDDSAVPKNPYRDSGDLDPLVQKWAFDGDKRLRGKGPSMDALQSDLKQALERGKKCPKAKE